MYNKRERRVEQVLLVTLGKKEFLNLYLLVFIYLPQKTHCDYFGGPLAVTMGTMLGGLHQPNRRPQTSRNPNSSLG